MVENVLHNKAVSTLVMILCTGLNYHYLTIQFILKSWFRYNNHQFWRALDEIVFHNKAVFTLVMILCTGLAKHYLTIK